ncbi:MAG TPA: protein kinase [Anaerolineae bacterium]|nr:protein kinase [Anaerolineae bacterium]
MSQQSPRKLGKYEIIEEIGRGANGIVYKAADTRLQRTVALKVLHPRVLWEPDLVARFYKEASAAASLEHPNILDVHDVDEAEGVHYIAMKYLPGRTIKQILDQHGPIPLHQAVPIVDQIASALDHAHKEGLLHRDLRPSNIMVDDQGHATLMDFGLAVGIDSAYASGPSGLTGTAEYIAPEVWRNHKPDERADLYSLGVVVYEMLVGEPPFKADSAAAIMTRHLTEEPAFPPGLPEKVRLVLAKALAKDREQRYQRAKELAQALEDTLAVREEISETVETKEAQPGSKRPAAGWIVAGVLGIALVTTFCFVLLRGGGLPPTLPPTKTATPTHQRTATWTNTATMSPTATATPTATPTATDTSTPSATPPPTVIPTQPTAALTLPAPTPAQAASGQDTFGGERITFVSERDGNPEIYIMNVDGSGQVRLTDNTATDGSPALSPDGTHVAFVRNNQILVLSTDGASEINVTPYPAVHRSPFWTADGQRIVFTSDRDDPDRGWKRSYEREWRLYAVNADGTGLSRSTGTWDQSPDGTRTVFMCSRDGNIEICVRNVDGTGEKRLTYHPHSDLFPVWSPNGPHIAFVRNNRPEEGACYPGCNCEVYIINADGSDETNLSNSPAVDDQPSWASDGSHIVFVSDRDGNPEIYVMNSDGTQQKNLSRNPAPDYSPSWAGG